MFSVAKTGINLFPLCTAIVNPTKSGVIVEALYQVLITALLFEACASSTRLNNL